MTQVLAVLAGFHFDFPRLNPRALQSCALATGILHRAVTRSVTAGYRYFRKTHQTYPSKKSSYSTQVSAVSRVQADRYILMMFGTPSFECPLAGLLGSPTRFISSELKITAIIL